VEEFEWMNLSERVKNAELIMIVGLYIQWQEMAALCGISALMKIAE
jgi:hypothetical protein